MHKRIFFAAFVVCCVAISCNSPYTSKKRGYFNIDLPQHAYQTFDKDDFPFIFEYPVYGNVIRDSTFFEQNPDDKYWVNLDFPQYNARIFLSYKVIGGNSVYKIKQPNGTYRDSIGTNHFDKLVNDAFALTGKNEVVATSIRDSLFKNPQGIAGVYFKVGGNAATGRQFFMTDTTKNFIRGALYFASTPNADSIAPVQDFLEKDIKHLLNSFRWK